MSPLLSTIVTPRPLEHRITDRPVYCLADNSERDTGQRAGDDLGGEDV